MKLAVSTYSLSRWQRENRKTLAHTVDEVARFGVEGIEFAALTAEEEQMPTRSADALRRRAEKNGLAVASLCVAAELLRPRNEQAKVVESLRRRVELAAALGAPSMRHDVTRGFGDYSKGLRGPRTFDSAVKLLVPGIREVADYAAAKGVRTSLENHGFYMQESKRVEQLIKAVDHENFGLTIDMGNFLCVNEDPVKAVKRLARYVQMAHAKDFHLRPKDRMPPAGWFATPTKIALRGAIAGHGVIDIPAELKLLRQAGYDGFLSLEFEGLEEPLQAVRLGLDYLRAELAKLR
jgi:sugar phosphate isomerase/epimerase